MYIPFSPSVCRYACGSDVYVCVRIGHLVPDHTELTSAHVAAKKYYLLFEPERKANASAQRNSILTTDLVLARTESAKCCRPTFILQSFLNFFHPSLLSPLTNHDFLTFCLLITDLLLVFRCFSGFFFQRFHSPNRLFLLCVQAKK